MDLSKSLFLFVLFLSSLLSSQVMASPYHDHYLKRHGGISKFRLINRRSLINCPVDNPYLSINVSMTSPLPDESYVTVTVNGVLHPDNFQWIAMISPSNSSVSGCPLASLNYIQTGDFSNLPLLCHYPVKAQFLSKDPLFLNCTKKICHKKLGNDCLVHTCGGSVTFHVINIRTEIEFVLFTGGFEAPCVLKRTGPIRFANPSAPLYGHLSSIDSSGTSMRLTWVSGDQRPQQVQYANGKSSPSVVTTFTKEEMCSFAILPSPAQDFGWHEPGYIHSTIMTGLQPSSTYTYRYGSDLVGWSKTIKFKTPPVGGSNESRFIVYGDMGKAPLDPSVEHYIQPGSISVTSAINRIIEVNNIDSIFHIGDISYATGFLAEWEYFLNLIEPYASRISYMTAIGNHERDYGESGSVCQTPDSGGECGVPYESYFQMPVSEKDKPWYSIEQGPIHFTIISTEHTWSPNSTQYRWIEADFLSVNRTRTPWLIFAGHRPMYSSTHSLIPSVDTKFRNSIEPLLLKYKVDLVLFGHVHNYERTCAIYQYQCKGVPRKGKSGIDTYYNSNYTAPVHVIVGMAGFSLDSFPSNVKGWSLARFSEYGFARVSTTRNNLQFEFVNSTTMEVRDKFRIVK
ncbi:putative inactive purple acid phosphatase 27 [Carex littledalei]|uniref:Purple acid phosphatase n=1 Tax=Carex littledalei TaxID=544730 RepID=A0A833QQI2_9POAL|nr:putative inactive purple acid phosphatase 27 [Carex littledalei]